MNAQDKSVLMRVNEWISIGEWIASRRLGPASMCLLLKKNWDASTDDFYHTIEMSYTLPTEEAHRSGRIVAIMILDARAAVAKLGEPSDVEILAPEG
jgi:hypothetical protein